MDTFDYEAGNPFVDDELYDVDLTFSGQDQNAVTDGSLHSFTVLENHSSFSAEPVDRNDSKGANKNGKAQNRVSARDMDDIALHLLQGWVSWKTHKGKNNSWKKDSTRALSNTF